MHAFKATITPAETAAREEMLATFEDQLAELVAEAVRESYEIGGEFRGPGIRKSIGEGHPARSVWDMVQGITAVARGKGHQDERLAMERRAGQLLDKVA